MPQNPIPSKEIESSIHKFWDVVKLSGELIVSLQEDNASLAQKVAGIEDLFDGKKVEYAALTNRLTELQTQIDGYQSRIQKVSIQEAQQKDLLDSLEEKNRKIKEITSEKNALESENLTLGQTVESLQEAVLNHEQSLRRIELLEQEKQDLTAYLDEMKEFEQNREIIQKELARRNVEVNARINEAQEYKNQIAEIEGKLFEIPKLKEEIEKLITSLSTITEERDLLLQTHDQAAEFTKNYEDLQSKLQEYSNQNLESQNQKDLDDTTIAEAFERITDLENKLNSEQSTQARLHVELRSAREYEEQIARHLGALDEYSSQIQELKRQKSTTEQLFAEAQSAMLAAQAAFEVEKSSNWDLSEKYQILSGQLVTAQNELEKQLKRYNTLDETFKSTNQNYKELKEAIELTQVHANEYLTAKNEAVSKLEKEIAQRTTLEIKNVALESELNQEKSRTLELQGEIEKISLAKIEIEEKVRELQEIYDSLITTNEVLNKDLITTKKETDYLHNELEKIALAKADIEEKLREVLERQATSEASNELSGKELIASKKETAVLQSELEKIALAKADAEEKLQETIEMQLNSETKVKEVSKELFESKKECTLLQDELEKLALAKAGIEEKILEEIELRNNSTKKIEQLIEDKSLLTKELQIKIEQEELDSNELVAELTRTKEEVKSLRKKLSIEEEEKTQQTQIIQQYKEAHNAADRIHQDNKNLERERDDLTIELSKVRQALYNSNEQMQKNENELLSRIDILNKELAVAQTEDKVLKSASVRKGKNIIINEPTAETPVIEDKRAVVVNKIGDILARLEEALHQPE